MLILHIYFTLLSIKIKVIIFQCYQSKQISKITDVYIVAQPIITLNIYAENLSHWILHIYIIVCFLLTYTCKYMSRGLTTGEAPLTYILSTSQATVSAPSSSWDTRDSLQTFDARCRQHCRWYILDVKLCRYRSQNMGEVKHCDMLGWLEPAVWWTL